MIETDKNNMSTRTLTEKKKRQPSQDPEADKWKCGKCGILKDRLTNFYKSSGYTCKDCLSIKKSIISEENKKTLSDDKITLMTKRGTIIARINTNKRKIRDIQQKINEDIEALEIIETLIKLD